MTARWWRGGGGRLGGGGTEQKGKRTYGHGQQCSDCGGGEGIRRLNGNEKNTIKSKKKKEYNEKTSCLQPRRGPSPEHDHAGALFSDFQNDEKNIPLLYKAKKKKEKKQRKCREILTFNILNIS